MGLANGFFFRLGEGGSHIFGKEGNKLFEEPIETLLWSSFSFTETTPSEPFVNVVSDVHGGGLFKF